VSTSRSSAAAASASQNGRQAMERVIETCRNATGPDRALAARIALAAFPALADLEQVGPAIWRQRDGTRVRAMRYSTSIGAASSLVPAGCWVEAADGRVTVFGPTGEWTGTHRLEAVALCIAALTARAAELPVFLSPILADLACAWACTSALEAANTFVEGDTCDTYPNRRHR
jgi:hypothetical protein